MSPKNSKKWVDFALASGLYGAAGVQLIITSLGGFLGGEWLDKRFGTDPWLQLIGLFLGLTAGFFYLFKIVKTKF